MQAKIPGSITKAEFADAYEISPKTFNNWLKIAQIEHKGSHYLPPKLVDIIIDEFGVPQKWRQ